MSEGNAAVARSQKVSEKAVLAAADILGTLVEKTSFPAPSATTCLAIRDGYSMKEDNQNKHSRCWDHMIPT